MSDWIVPTFLDWLHKEEAEHRKLAASYAQIDTARYKMETAYRLALIEAEMALFDIIGEDEKVHNRRFRL